MNKGPGDGDGHLYIPVNTKAGVIGAVTRDHFPFRTSSANPSLLPTLSVPQQLVTEENDLWVIYRDLEPKLILVCLV